MAVGKLGGRARPGPDRLEEGRQWGRPRPKLTLPARSSDGPGGLGADGAPAGPGARQRERCQSAPNPGRRGGSPGSRAPLPAAPRPAAPPRLARSPPPRAGWTRADLPRPRGERPGPLMTAGKRPLEKSKGMRRARGVFRSFARVEEGAGSCALAPGPRASPPASRWGSRRQPRPAPKPRPLRPGRGRREGAGPAVPPPPCAPPACATPLRAAPHAGLSAQHPPPARPAQPPPRTPAPGAMRGRRKGHCSSGIT